MNHVSSPLEVALLLPLDPLTPEASLCVEDSTGHSSWHQCSSAGSSPKKVVYRAFRNLACSILVSRVQQVPRCLPWVIPLERWQVEGRGGRPSTVVGKKPPYPFPVTGLERHTCRAGWRAHMALGIRKTWLKVKLKFPCWTGN